MARRLKLAQKRGPQKLSPELELSVLVDSILGIQLSPEKIKAFIRDHFMLLSILAHEIHAAEIVEKHGVELNT